jgi:hypothetical protein
MKTYVITNEAPIANMYPPLNRQQKSAIYEQYLFAPLREKAKLSNNQLLIKDELDLVGKAIIQASEEIVRELRLTGFRLQVKKGA